jgi:2-polyprenyl-6-methoxyphenol hydroxylase-like FAD-dependent oxidoreductase
MNTAIADGFDLGWRLAWVLRAWAEPSVLDGYETERRPFAEHNLTRSAAPMAAGATSSASCTPTSVDGSVTIG